MRRYLKQLINELPKATWRMKPPHEIWEESEANQENELKLEDMSHVEKCLYDNEMPICLIVPIWNWNDVPDAPFVPEVPT